MLFLLFTSIFGEKTKQNRKTPFTHEPFVYPLVELKQFKNEILIK